MNSGTPSPARIYNYLLGGKDHQAVDRDAAEEALRALPDLRLIATRNRAFIGRAVAHLAEECGIDQFLDIGHGIPGPGNTAEIVHGIRPHARVVFADYDPVVTAHTRALIESPVANRVAAVEADIRKPETILNAPEVRELLDFERPIAVVMGALLHFVTTAEDAAGIVAAIREALAPGSALIISHATDSAGPPHTGAVVKSWDRATSKVTLRSPQEIAELFNGFDLIVPGIVAPSKWRPDTTRPLQSETTWLLAGVALLSATPSPGR